MVNDVVMVKDHNLPRNSCRLGRVIDGLVRKVKLRMADSNIDNPGKTYKMCKHNGKTYPQSCSLGRM